MTNYATIIHYKCKKVKLFATFCASGVYCSSREHMKKTIYLATSVVTVISFAMFSFAPVASAYTCGVDSAGKPIETSIDFGNGPLCSAGGANPITAILLWAINLMAIGVGIAVTVGIIFGGITYAMSDGDTGKAKEGREIIGNAIIGLFLFIFLWSGANFLIPGGLFNR